MNGSIKFDCKKLNITSADKIIGKFQSRVSATYVKSGVIVHYTDGTTDSTYSESIKKSKLYDLEVNVNKQKKLSYIQIYLEGKDIVGEDSWIYFRNLILTNISK